MTRDFILRLSSLLLVTVLVFNGVWFLAVPLALFVMLYFDAYEYIVLAWLIDVYYAPGTWSFWYTGYTTLAVVLTSWVRPYLRWRRYEAE